MHAGHGYTRVRLLPCLALASAMLMGGSSALAQEMGQGQAHITTRSDVRLSLESVPGTGAARLAALGRALGGAMTPIRTCYGDVVAARPTVQGTLRLRVSLAERGAASVEVVEDGAGDAELIRCIQRALRAVDLASVERPAAAVMVLELNNSAAAGAAETARRAEAAADVEVAREEGRPVARGEGPGLRFVVRGEASAADAIVADTWRVVRSQLAGLLDCRRRASRRGMSPAGVITLGLRVRPSSAPETSLVSSTVVDTRAGSCVERAMRRPHRRSETGPGRLELEVTFLE